jgi:uncharacterized protein (TIGR03000 family)
MNLRRGFLALVMAGVLTNQASAQFFPGFNSFGGLGGWGGFGGGWPGTWGGGYGPGFGGWGGYGGFGGYGFSVPTVWQTGPITAYTTATTVTRPVIPANSPLLLDPNYLTWAMQNGYLTRGGQLPRARNTLYPATPVEASDLATPRVLTASGAVDTSASRVVPAATVVDNRATIQLLAPTSTCKVCIDGTWMNQTGLVRQYVTPPLEPGYDYTINIQLQTGGQLRSQVAHVRAGGQRTVDFTK